MGILMSATKDPSALRVSSSGDITVANRVTLLFERAGSLIRSALDENYQPPDWHQKARQAVLDKLVKEVARLSDTVSREDKAQLDALLSSITQPNIRGQASDWRTRLSAGIEALRASGTSNDLAEALHRIDQLTQAGNGTLLDYMRPHLKGQSSLPEALEKGLQSWLVKQLGLAKDTASSASKNIAWAMEQFGSTLNEAIEIARCAGRMVNQGESDNSMHSAMSLALLRIRHGASPEQAKRVLGEVKSLGAPLNELHHEIGLMLSYDIAPDEAEAIVALAASVAGARGLQGLSIAQCREIAWLRLHHDLSPEEAIFASLIAGRISGTRPPQCKIWAQDIRAWIRDRLQQQIAGLMPKGWPDQWESSSNGARRLKDTRAFSEKFLDYLRDSLNEGHIDKATGLSTTFLKDAGRTTFRFGSRPHTTMVKRDPAKALASLAALIPEPKVRQNLTRSLFQGGPNGFVFAMTIALGQSEASLFSILSLDEDNNEADAKSTSTISIETHANGKIRVGYQLYLKHFCLLNVQSDFKTKINSRFDSSTGAKVTDHTARAIALIEFDSDELRQGILNPRLVSPPQLHLTIEPDYEDLMQSMTSSLITGYGQSEERRA